MKNYKLLSILKKIIAIYCEHLREHTIHCVEKRRNPSWILMQELKYSSKCCADG